MAKIFSPQDTKTQKWILAKGFPLCLRAFVANFSGLSGYKSTERKSVINGK